MNINLLTNYTLSLFKERLVPTLTAQQKKVVAIASLALGLFVACLAAYYVLSRYRFKAQLNPDAQNQLKPEPVVEPEPMAEPELEVHAMEAIHSRTRRENELFYHNIHFAEPRLNAKTTQEAETLKAKLLAHPLTFALEIQEICASYKNDKQKFLKILFFLVEAKELPRLLFFRNLVKLLRAYHTANPIPLFMIEDFRRKLLDQSWYNFPDEMGAMFRQYFETMTPEDFADATLLYPIPEPKRATPMLIDPTPFAGQSNVVRIVGEGTNNLEINEYVHDAEVKLRTLFNHLYTDYAHRVEPQNIEGEI